MASGTKKNRNPGYFLRCSKSVLKSRKRPRPGINFQACGIVCLFGSQVRAFAPSIEWPRPPSHDYSVFVDSWELALGITSTETSIVRTQGNAQDLPPWLLGPNDADDYQRHIEDLEYSLIEHGVDVNLVLDLVNTVHVASDGDHHLIVSICNFLQLLVNVAVEDQAELLLTRGMLMACVYHVTDCFEARRKGITTEALRGVIHMKESDVGLLPATVEVEDDWSPAADEVDSNGLEESSLEAGNKYLCRAFVSSRDEDSEIRVDEDVMFLAEGANRIKRAEMLVDAVLGGRSKKKDEADRIRDWLLSTMSDWRSLTVRVVACLYRLDGLKDETRSTISVREAKQAMYIYAPLAERLGLDRLKSRIEERAFQLLYPRQHSAVSALYNENRRDMQILSKYLLSRINAALKEDESLMAELEGFSVSSRVKGLYSFWKKLLKTKMEKAIVRIDRPSLPSSTLAATDVQDGIALRVVFQAKQWTEDEATETTRAREAFLCYYIQNLIRQKWPEIEASRVKDYVRYPKPNGYQSLHHTSLVSCRGTSYPFEIQVRSEEMHRIAEYGVAAHWNYKLGTIVNTNEGQPLALLPPGRGSSSADDSLVLASEPDSRRQGFVAALENSRKSLLSQQVYVFLDSSGAPEGRGKLLSMPVGSVVGDIFEYIELEGHARFQFLLNGHRTSAVEELQNGDMLMLSVLAE